MPITFSCPNPHCPRTFTVKDEFAGKTSKCPGCSASITVPMTNTPPPPPLPVQSIQTVPVAPPPPPIATKQLFCTNCGNVISEQAVACMSCGAKPTGHKKFCRQCGVGLNPEQVICIKCGTGLTGGFGIGGIPSSTNQDRSVLPIIQAGLMVLLFFSPQLIIKFYASSRSYGGIMGGFFDSAIDKTELIWGWNSWFGILTLVLGCLILAGKVAEYCLPNINKLPQSLYSGLYGIAALCLLGGYVIGCFGYGIWLYDKGVSIPLEEIYSMIKNRRGTMLVFPATAILALGITVLGVLQPWLSQNLLNRMQRELSVLGLPQSSLPQNQGLKKLLPLVRLTACGYICFGLLIPLILPIIGHFFWPSGNISPNFMGIVFKIICIFGVIIGHRGLKTNNAKSTSVLFFCGFIYLLMYPGRSLYFLIYYLPGCISPYFGHPYVSVVLISMLDLLWHITFILGVYFGHKGLKTSEVKSAKFGLHCCWIAFLIYMLSPLLLLFRWFFG